MNMDLNKKNELLYKIRQMDGCERVEHWRNQTLVNRDRTNDDIIREYYSLIAFIEKEYKERFECIQSPILHLISHCMELFYKCIIKQGHDQKLIQIDYSEICNEHSLSKLLPSILKMFDFFVAPGDCPPEDETNFKITFPMSHNNIVELLKTDVTTYRYASKQNKKGETRGIGHPFREDYDSANMIDLFKLFHECYDSLNYMGNIINTFYTNDDQ